MVTRCVICKSVPRRGVLRFFHEIPHNNELKLQWLLLISSYLGNNKFHRGSGVCCDHFSPDDYHCRITGKLKESAVPTLPSLYFRNLERQLKNQSQNNNVAKEDNNNTHSDLSEDTVNIECEELIIKYDDGDMDDSPSEFTNKLIDSDVQMMDVEKGALSADPKLNTMVQKPVITYLEGTFDPGTAENLLSTYSGVVSNEVEESDKSEKAFSSEDFTSIMAFIENIHSLEAEKKKTLQTELKRLKQYMKTLKTGAKNRENQLLFNVTTLESKLKMQKLIIEDLMEEKKTLTVQLKERLQAFHLEINKLQLSDRLQTENSISAKELLSVKTNECLEYKNKLSSVWQELASVKVNLTNCKEEKAKLENSLGLEAMRNDMELLRKKYHDLSESYRLKAFREVEVEEEVQSLRLRLEYATGVCRLAGVSLEDLASLDAIEAKYRNSGGLPKTWKNQFVAHKLNTEQVVELEKKEEECRQLRKELARLRKLSDECSNDFRLSDLCEYCGM